jgi:hypothetical protein
MITVCAGWGKIRHIEPIVLKPEDGGEPGTSHGMCPACEEELNITLVQDEEYRAYLQNPFYDPRD